MGLDWGWAPWQLQLFGVLLAFYHVSEFTLAAVFMRQQLSWSSWLITKPYCLAMGTGLLEFWLESWLWPQLKQLTSISLLGLVLAVLGETIRKAGMVTAGRNFTHTIQSQKSPQHQLVTWGIYRFVRHPGYLGWFLWSVGTQVLLVNPFCAIGFAIVAWRFFKARLRYEEALLVNFFGLDYVDYRARTPTYIPFLP
mmetsp:Transcript_18687/g.52514  ORF Transcript_18687/g.52514 Transcript_18687/m.52514 type:complete len:196 (-) Transcript_18687:848-1435(-)